jgi:hypothetical protein
VLSELKNRGILKQLQVVSSREKFDVWALELSQDEENVISVVNDHIKANAGYSLYDAQLAIAEAHKRCLAKKKATLCISEWGSGDN